MSRADILARFGIIDRPELIVHATKEADVLWRVGIHGKGDPLTALLPKRALELSEELRRANEEELANRIVMEIEKANRYNTTGP